MRLSGPAPMELAADVFLYGPDKRLLAAPTQMDLNQRHLADHRAMGCFLVHKKICSTIHAREWDGYKGKLQDVLMSMQIVKPLRTSGFIYQCTETNDQISPPFSGELRSPMEPGQWPQLRPFDEAFLKEAPGVAARVERVMSGGSPELKNSIYLFQLALEHHHPAIACVLAVSSMEAALETSTATRFEKELCLALGTETRAFPNWNEPLYPQPSHTVGELAFPLHKLRSKIVHGADLREATDKNHRPINFGELRTFIQERADPTYMQLLCESSICLAAQVLKKRL